MVKTARIIYLIIGSLFPLVIGALHIYSHFRDLVTDQVKEILSSSIPILGKEQTLWNTWGIMSVMMGVAFVVIGLLNISIYIRLRKDESPPISSLVIMGFYLLGVIYASSVFQQVPQFYGGIFGLTLTVICIFFSLKARN